VGARYPSAPEQIGSPILDAARLDALVGVNRKCWVRSSRDADRRGLLNPGAYSADAFGMLTMAVLEYAGHPFSVLRANTDRPIKITVPGPFTMSQQAQDDHDKDEVGWLSTMRRPSIPRSRVSIGAGWRPLSARNSDPT
jgi:hypothetical protein